VQARQILVEPLRRGHPGIERSDLSSRCTRGARTASTEGESDEPVFR
jgi:hypothetical protein